MDPYLLLVFVHVVGAIGVFAGLAMEAVAFGALVRSRTAEHARPWVTLLRTNRIGQIGMLATLVTGIWMMIVRWGPQAWMMVAIGGLAIMIAAGIALTLRPLKRLGAALEGDSPSLPATLRGGQMRRALALSLWLRGGVALGIVALMTIKPGLTLSLAIMAAAVLVGLAAAGRPVRQPTPASAA